jgi:ubiquinone/menaquinone biosynthesis C-methylase UbiE
MSRGARRFDLLREAAAARGKRPGERRARCAGAAPESLAARGAAGAAAGGGSAPPAVPNYLRDCYAWAYLSQSTLTLLDRPLVVSAILWGNYRRLRRAVLAELRPGQRVLQPACVYGDFSPSIARFLGSRGRLEVCDVAPLQVENCRSKLKDFPQASVRLRDAATPGGGGFDAVCCFFLLHEMPEDYKRAVVDALLSSVRPGGKVIFVDYHRPHWAHPLKAVMSLVFDTLEPFAKDLWRRDIAGYASAGEPFIWSKETYFGGLYQKVVARRGSDPEDL